MPCRHLSVVDDVRMIQMLEDGATQRAVSGRMGVSRSVVARHWRRYQETGGHSRRPGQGRNRLTTQAEDRYLQLLARRNRTTTARGLEMMFRDGTGIHLSNQTVRNRLHEGGLHSRRPVRAPILTGRHRRARLDFASSHRDWQLRHWRHVLFTDESRFHISTCDRRVRVWRSRGERYADCNIVEYDRFGGGSVMVWGGICIDGRTDLYVIPRGTMNAQRYRDEILDQYVRPFAGAIGDGFLFMQDNARAHTARVCTEYLEEEAIDVMEWPARSPDLNPIENVWDILFRRIHARLDPPNSIQTLSNALREEWDAIPQPMIQRIITSMGRRCRMCCQARGGHIPY